VAIDVVFAGIPVAEIEGGIEWYERLLGRPPDMTPNETERAWQLTGDSWIYVVLDRERAGGGLAALMVDDLDERIGEIDERGIQTGQVERINERTRSLVVLDPDGNRITLGEVSSAD
jgi:catechol 2,3-dioxygenase-like lactoylglutathione lyase family enzyme